MIESSPPAVAVLFIGLIAAASTPMRIAMCPLGTPELAGYLATCLLAPPFVRHMLRCQRLGVLHEH